MKHGLVPSIGVRSAEFGEVKQAIYLFPDEIAMTDALGNWLGECFEEFDNLAVLQVDITGAELYSDVEWEIQCISNIGAEKIRFLRYE